MNSETRRLAEAIAQTIKDDEWLGNSRTLNVVVEDNAVISTEIEKALGKLGILVLIGVTGYHRRQNSGPYITGTLEFSIGCFENPLFNRTTQNSMTAQAVAERLAVILHWAKPEGFDNPIVFDSFDRDDDNKANIEIVRFHVEQSLGMD